jgi:hypothetical protein
MAAEELGQGVVIPLVDFTSEHFAGLEDTLQEAPGFATDPAATVGLLNSFETINLHMVLRRELVRLERRRLKQGRGRIRSIEEIETELQERFIEAPWPAEVPRIIQSEQAKALGAGALVVASCKPALAARIDMKKELARLYGLSRVPRDVFSGSFIPGVQLAYARDHRELGYLHHLKTAINRPRQTILPATFEPGEQLKLR